MITRNIVITRAEQLDECPPGTVIVDSSPHHQAFQKSRTRQNKWSAAHPNSVLIDAAGLVSNGRVGRAYKVVYLPTTDGKPKSSRDGRSV